MASKESAQAALYAAVEKLAEAAVDYNGPVGAAMLRDAAIAYRAAAGGAQPGSVVVESK
jgi:hypothetical protein